MKFQFSVHFRLNSETKVFPKIFLLAQKTLEISEGALKSFSVWNSSKVDENRILEHFGWKLPSRAVTVKKDMCVAEMAVIEISLFQREK